MAGGDTYRWLMITMVGELAVGVALSSAYAFAGVGRGFTTIALHLAAAVVAVVEAAAALVLPPLVAAWATARAAQAVRSVRSITTENSGRGSSTNAEEERFPCEDKLDAARLAGHAGPVQRVGGVAVCGFGGRHGGPAVATVPGSDSPTPRPGSRRGGRGVDGCCEDASWDVARWVELAVGGAGHEGVRGREGVE